MEYYKIEQLTKMLESEKRQAENEKFGAHLTHWSGNANPINIDEGALQVLIDYYKNKED